MNLFNKYKEQLKRNTIILKNFSYITLFQIVNMLIPFITYPYLVKVLGKDVYGIVITAQILASYASILVIFGFQSVSARHIAIYKQDISKMSEVFCSVFITRIFFSLVAFLLYIIVIFIIPEYRDHLILFLISYGLIINELLFPQFFFQGIEKMKYITIINSLVRILAMCLIFLIVKSQDDYMYVPLCMIIGYIIAGILSMYVVFYKEKIIWVWPKLATIKYYVKDASPIFFTDVICTIKDKFNYLLVGSLVGMGEVVIYDLGSKLMGIITKPIGIVGIVIFPKIAREKNFLLFTKISSALFLFSIIIVVLVNIFLDDIVFFFLKENIDLLPIRLFLLAPILLSFSSFSASNFFIAFGYNNKILVSILVTTIAYLISLATFYFTNTLHSVLPFIIIALISYFAEFTYRLMQVIKIKNIKNGNN